jgi:SAM-dependent methyltransferase
MDLGIPRIFTIREADHRIHNPIDETKLATLGRALRLAPGTRMLDLACGSAEMLATWARDHGVEGIGVDVSAEFLAAGRARCEELGVEERVELVHADAAGFTTDPPVDLACCIGATWIGDGLRGTIDLLERSLTPDGMILVGEPYWRPGAPEEARRAVLGEEADAYVALPDLVGNLSDWGWDVVEMVLADPDSWDRYVAPQWLSMRRWLATHPDDDFAPAVRDALDRDRDTHLRWQRDWLGWGVFALLRR